MKQDKEFIRQWEAIIAAVDKTNIPIHFINRVILIFTDSSRNQTIDVQAFRKQGYKDEDIEEIIATVVYESDASLDEMEFFVDVENVAAEVQLETEKLLVNLQ